MVPILSIIVIGVLLYIMLRENCWQKRYADLFATVCVLQLCWFQGYFFKIGQHEVSSLYGVAGYCLLIYSFYLLFSGRVYLKKNILMTVIGFITIIIFGMIYEKLLPYDGLLMPEQSSKISWDGYVAGKCLMYQYVPSVSSFLRPLWEVFIFAFEVLIFKQIYSFEWFISPYMRIVGWLKYVIYYGYFEFIVKNVIGNLTFTFDFAAILLGVNEESIYTDARIRDGIFYTLQGGTREPSHYNCVLFNIAMLMLLGNILRKFAQKRGWNVPQTYSNMTFLLCLVLMLLTGGFSSVWFLFIIACCTILLRIRENGGSVFGFFLCRKLILLSFVGVCIIVSYVISQNDYLYNRLMDALEVIEFLGKNNGFVGIGIIGGNSGIGSTIARFVSIYEGWQVFMARPLLGISWHVQYIHDFSIFMLMNMGILGVYALYRMLSVSRENLRYDVLILGLIFMIGGLPVTVSTGGLCLHWLLFFEATTFYMNHWEEKDVSAKDIDYHSCV
ncbi:hypothetical protein SAMN05216366_10152 [Selenomonas ruminantium]|uniref:O-Antigen ligase n=1 Tax=Selenomonas ruminantium TaxID=971 RepID=A0A1H0M7H7_SELRU|nr:hypothetical protein SAMN05216366_10152 [Selenomonas ruminantium]